MDRSVITQFCFYETKPCKGMEELPPCPHIREDAMSVLDREIEPVKHVWRRFSYMQPYGDTLAYRVFFVEAERLSCRKTEKRRYRISCAEGYRIVGKNQYYNDAMYFTVMVGYRIAFDTIFKDWHGYKLIEAEPNFVWKKSRWEPSLWAIQGTRKEDIEHLLPPHFVGDWSNFYYLRNYLLNPQAAERLAKAKLGYMVFDQRFLRLKPETQKKLVSWIKQHPKEMETRPSYNQIFCSMKHNFPIEDYVSVFLSKRTVLKNISKTFAELGINLAEREKEIVDYVIGLTSDRHYYYQVEHSAVKFLSDIKNYACDYSDYLSMAKEIGWNVREKNVLMPLNFNKKHEEARKLLDLKRNREKMAKMKSEVAESTKDLPVSVKVDEETEATLITDYEELLKTGEELHNCVAHCGYYEKMAKKESFIVLVLVKGKRMNCAEISFKDYKVLQNRGDHNGASPYQKKAEKAVSLYIEEAKKARAC